MEKKEVWESLFRLKNQKRWYLDGNTFSSKTAALRGSGPARSSKYEYKARLKK